VEAKAVEAKAVEAKAVEAKAMEAKAVVTVVCMVMVEASLETVVALAESM
jgi:hypothetical protein